MMRECVAVGSRRLLPVPLPHDGSGAARQKPNPTPPKNLLHLPPSSFHGGRPQNHPRPPKGRRSMGLPWLRSEVWKAWDRNGKATFLREVSKYVADMAEVSREGAAGTSLSSKGEQFKQAIYILVKKGCTGKMKKERVATVLQEICASSPHSASLIVESFVALDEETSARPELRDKFIAIARCIEGELSFLIMERLNMDNLADVGVVPNKKIFSTKFIRLKTKLYFKQQKYNLFREESEGYSKLMAELSNPSDSSVTYTTTVVQCLIGRFNLDPNRVFDIVLEAFECNPISSFFIPLIRNLNSSSNTICEILGFKLQNQDGPMDALFFEIALLIQHGIIKLEEIYGWLIPDDRYIKREWERQLKDAKEYARKSMIVSINKEKEEEPEDIETPDDRFSENQKFCLCEALLSIGDWEHASVILKRHPPYALASRKRIAFKLAKLIEYLLEPLYQTIRKRQLPVPDIKGSEPVKLSNQEKAAEPARNYGEVGKWIDVILAIGPYLYHEPIVIHKLSRIIQTYLSRKANECPNNKPLYFKFVTVFDEVILPSLSYLDSNCCITEEVWKALQLYPYHQRFRLYGSWKGETMLLTHPSMLKRRVDLVKKIKHMMRRLSKENVKLMGRQLGKMAHSMPAVVFDYVLSQVQLFDNLINPVIDALKFLTSLCYDVLGYCLLEALSPGPTITAGSMSVMLMPNRPRTKHDGSTISSWLQNLSSFTGAICKKYNIELVPILQYISNQLKAKQGLDLLLLKEIVQKMTGVEAAEEMTTEQLEAMGGGELLRSEAGYFGQIRSAKKSGARLREAVSLNDLAITLCILMAQQRNCIIYEDSHTLHTKLVGKLYDQCQDTLVQFGTFLANSCTMDDYSKKIPTLNELVRDFHVPPDVAFFLWRPIFAFQIGSKYDELRRAEKNHKSMTVQQRQDKYTDASNFLFVPVAEVMRNFLAPKIWEDISPQFYVTFWSLSLFDLHVPADAYMREINRVKQQSIGFGENKDLSSSKRKKEQERCSMMIEKLQEEERRQREHVDRVIAKLNKEKDSWFASRIAKSAKNEAVTAFLQHCLFPRCIFTGPDALYCAHFVNIIHALSTPNFSTLICYDRIFCDIIYTVTSCTENEANRYGKFLCALLGTVMKWHSDKSVFDRECASFPGFVTKFRAANAVMTESSDHVDYENFRHVCHKWHYKITKCVIVCLESKDFIQIRNALIVLKRILPHYPKVSNLASAVERWIERVRADEKDKRQDLFALATSYIGQLKAKWNTLISEEDFHQKQQEKEKLSKPKVTPTPTKDDKNPPNPVALKERKKIGSPNPLSPTSSNGSTQSTTAPLTAASKLTNGNSTPSSCTSSPVSVKRESTPVVNTPPPQPRKEVKEASQEKPTPAVAVKKEPSVGSPPPTQQASPTEPIPKLIIKVSQTQGAAEAKEERPKEKDKRKSVKLRDEPTESVASNGTTITAATTPTISSPANSSPSPDRKRKERKTDRKRERESSAHSETKRKRTEDSYKVPSSSSSQKTSTRTVLMSNGETHDKDRISKEDRSPKHSTRDRSSTSSRTSVQDSSKSSKHSRYK